MPLNNFHKYLEKTVKKCTLCFLMTLSAWYINVSSMKTKNYYTVILRSDSDEESFEDSSLRSEWHASFHHCQNIFQLYRTHVKYIFLAAKKTIISENPYSDSFNCMSTGFEFYAPALSYADMPLFQIKTEITNNTDDIAITPPILNNALLPVRINNDG